MIHDARVEVTCDGSSCNESIDVALPFVYPDYSGKNGRFDHRTHVVNQRVAREGWLVAGDDEHYCWSCRESRQSTSAAHSRLLAELEEE